MPARLAQGILAQAHAACDQGDYAAVDALLAPCLAPEPERSGPERAQAHALQSLVDYRRNRGDAATRHAALALQWGQAGSDALAQAEGRCAWARVAWMLGDLDDALAQLTEALPLARGTGQARVQVHALNLTGLVHADLGQLDRSMAFHQAALDLARASGVPDLQLVGLTNLAGRALAMGDALVRQGRPQPAEQAWEQAVEMALQAEALAQAHGLEHALPHVLVTQAGACWRLARHEQAKQAFARHDAIVREHGDRSSVPHAALQRARQCQALGQPAAALATVTEGLLQAEDLRARSRQAELHLLASQLHEAQREFEPALRHHQRYHALREQSAMDAARQKSIALAVRMSTEGALERAHSLARLNQQLQETAHALRGLAYVDALTQVSNRRHLDDELTRRHAAQRQQGRRLYLALLDVDHFKAVNDTHSHAVGDEVLGRLGALLRANCRDHDFVARYGGEEFVWLLHCQSMDEAVQAGERLRLAVEQAPWSQVRPGLQITLSIGLAEASAAEEPEQGLAWADEALYRAKREGRNCLRIHGAAL